MGAMFVLDEGPSMDYPINESHVSHVLVPLCQKDAPMVGHGKLWPVGQPLASSTIGATPINKAG